MLEPVRLVPHHVARISDRLALGRPVVSELRANIVRLPASVAQIEEIPPHLDPASIPRRRCGPMPVAMQQSHGRETIGSALTGEPSSNSTTMSCGGLVMSRLLFGRILAIS